MAAGLMRRLYGAAVIAESCGLQPCEEIDPMVVAVMQEVGVDLMDHQPKGLADFAKVGFEQIIALSGEAGPRAEAVAAARGIPVDCWITEDPTAAEGSREMRLEAYRQIRRTLEARIVERFGPPQAGT
jgi:protein-tyrosine-phosphatase